MARGPIPYIVLKTNGDATPSASAQINVRGGGAATLFAAESGGGTLANPATTDSEGRITGWLDEGSYDITVSGVGITTVTRALEVLKGGGTFAEADGSITTAKIVDGAVTLAKLASNSVDSSKILDGGVADVDLTSPTSPAWRTVQNFQTNNAGTGVLSAQVYFGGVNSGNLLVPAGTGTQGPEGIWIPAPSDVSVPGKATMIRLKIAWATNATAPGTTLTWGLYPVTAIGGAGGLLALTLGTLVSGTTAPIVGAGAGTTGIVVGSAIDLSTISGSLLNTYIPGVLPSSSTAAASTVAFQVFLEMRHV